MSNNNTPMFQTEVYRKIYNNESGTFIEVGFDSDGLGLVHMHTAGNKQNVDAYGKLDLMLEPKMARLLGMALLASADEVEKVENESPTPKGTRV